MTTEIIYALGILALAIVFFVTEWLRVDVVAVMVLVALMLTGLLTTDEALAGFSNSAVLTIAALFIVGGAVLHTGLAGVIGRRILTIAGPNELSLVIVIMVSVALLSAFMSDTGTVAVLLPAIISLARSTRISTSKLLIPLSFGALLGGATTLIGTPPNIIVSNLLREQGMGPFEFFDYTPIGLLLLAAGVVFMAVFGRRILPDNKPTQEVQEREKPLELLNLYRLSESLSQLYVGRGSQLIDRTISESRFRSNYNVNIVEILRHAEPRPVASFGRQRLVVQSDFAEPIFPTPDTVVKADDTLIVQGEKDDVQNAAREWGLAYEAINIDKEHPLINESIGIAEVLLPPRSSLIGKTLTETRFGPSYNLSVLNINRHGVEEKLDLKSTMLRFGDTLLVQGMWHNILALKKRQRDFVVMGQPGSMIGAVNTAKAPAALVILLGMLVLIVTGTVSVAAASMLAALLMVLSGCLTMDEAYEAIDWKSIVLIAGMLPMSTALEKVGLVNIVAQNVTDLLGNAGPLIILASLFLLTSAFTQVLSNTATTVLIAPIAFATAVELGIRPQAFVMAVAIAASMAFASPVASPVNTLVLGAGNYRFSDYIKVGVPMILIMLVVTLVVLPILWPF